MSTIFKMRQYLVPVLLLAITAQCLSNVLPVLSLTQLEAETLGPNSQQNDNIFISNSYQIKDILKDKFHEIPYSIEKSVQKGIKNLHFGYTNEGNNPNIYNSIEKDNNNYDEGFRKEQWHNYPRQLDRLSMYFNSKQNTDKRNLYPENLINKALYPEATITDNKYRDKGYDMITNEFQLDSNPDTSSFYDPVATATNPLLILKIRLASLSNNLLNADTEQYQNFVSNENEITKNISIREPNIFDGEIYPALNMIKVKREGVVNIVQDNEVAEDASTENKAIKKRIFSLWSRIQGLNPKGHELPHRRHLHAFYGMPDNNGGGPLTAETRAILMRPPGSPLRWG